MYEYEAYLLNGMTERAIRLTAGSLTDAYAIAERHCAKGEFARGVNPEPIGRASWQYMTDAQDREQYGSGPEGLA